jgi:hypothetical protein
VEEKETLHQVAFQQQWIEILHGKIKRLCYKIAAIENKNQAG